MMAFSDSFGDFEISARKGLIFVYTETFLVIPNSLKLYPSLFSLAPYAAAVSYSSTPDSWACFILAITSSFEG